MRNFLDCSDLLNNKSFLLWFLIANFPIGLTEEEDALCEVMGDKYDDIIDQDFVNELTGYYDGIFDESDGYLDNPKSLKFDLNSDELVIEFHAGDTVYYLNDKELGCTGSEYFIHKISFEKFLKYSENLNTLEQLFIMPMVRITRDETEGYKKIVCSVIKNIPEIQDDLEDICCCIVTNCLPEE